MEVSDKMDNAKEWARAWASGLRMGVRWAVGEGPKPDQRARQILLGTAGAVIVLIAFVALVGGSGGHPAKVRNPGAQPGALSPTARSAHPAVLFAPSVPKSPAPTTTAPAGAQGSASSTTVAGGSAKGGRVHTRTPRHNTRAPRSRPRTTTG